jgi:hypothetical protein
VVQEMNLRTYAWADAEIYGSSQARVVAVREDARRRQTELARCRPVPAAAVVENDYPTVEGGYRRDLAVIRRPRETTRRRTGR